LTRSGDANVVVLVNVNAAENIENSSIPDEVATVSRTEFAAQLQQVQGQPAASPELTIATRVATPDRQDRETPGVIRGVDWKRVFAVRQQVRIVSGRLPGPGEIMVGSLVAAKLGFPPEALALGQTLIVEGQPWKIAGHFIADGSLAEAEIWCSLDDLRPALKRPNDLGLVALRFDPTGDPRQQDGAVEYFCRHRRPDLELVGLREEAYYASLRQHYSHIRALMQMLVVLIAIAGVCGAANTMYAAVAGRVREFAALQAVGFPRRAIALSLLQESVIVAATATLLAAGLAALCLNGLAVRFSMGAFQLALDRPTLALACGIGLLLGILGAVPPAFRAFRLPIAQALKAI
jgi:ABC-type antimicrobial peptide transport system permease subunit